MVSTAARRFAGWRDALTEHRIRPDVIGSLDDIDGTGASRTRAGRAGRLV
jgi:hypothetical protein